MCLADITQSNSTALYRVYRGRLLLCCKNAFHTSFPLSHNCLIFPWKNIRFPPAKMAATLKIARSTRMPMLREEFARRSNSGPESSVRVMRDGGGNQKLSELGVKNNTRILSSRVNPDEGLSFHEESMAEERRLKAEEQRASSFNRLKVAATTLAKRHSDGSLPPEDYNIELEDQGGQKVKFGTETDQRGIMMGLMLHGEAKLLIQRHEYKDALEVLTLGEEAFALCDPKLIDQQQVHALQKPEKELTEPMENMLPGQDTSRW